MANLPLLGNGVAAARQLFLKATGTGTEGDPYIISVETAIDLSEATFDVELGDLAITSSVLPTGAATSAKQDSMIAPLESLDTKVTAVNTEDVTITASALPTGAATSAKQDTMIGHLDGVEAGLSAVLSETAEVDANLTALNAKVTAVNTNDVTVTGSALPTGAASAANQTEVQIRIGDVAETAAASDTASSGLNGRLQRIAQRITTMLGVLPAARGQANKAGSLAVTLASDEDLLGRIGATNDSAATTDVGTFSLISLFKRLLEKWTAGLGLLASENVIGLVGSSDTVIDVTFSLDTAAYADGDLLADTQSLSAVGRVNAGVVVLQSLTLIDEDDQKQGLTLIFLDANNTLGTENAAPSVSDANARNIVGFVKVTAADYVDLGGVSVACLNAVGLEMKLASASTTLYVGAISNGTGTYTASGLKGKLAFLRS